MGLDMYLDGDAYFHSLSEKQRKTKPQRHVCRLGYWRKHPDLHGYIVENYGNGDDDCREISLGVEDLRQIIDAIRNDELPRTQGFFFGESTNDEEQKADDVAIFEEAIKWLNFDDGKTSRTVHYQASW